MPNQQQNYFDPTTWYSQRDLANSGQEIYYSAEPEVLYEYYDANQYAANNNSYNGSYYYSPSQPDMSLPH
jgi:hypothetical protein